MASNNSKNSSSDLSRPVSKYTSFLVMLIGLSVLIGWLFDIPVLKSSYPGFEGMKPSTAITFILSGLSLWFINYSYGKKWQIYFWRSNAAIVTILGGYSFLQYFFDIKFSVDQLFINESINYIKPVRSFHMSEATAFNFVLVGISLLLYSWKASTTSRVLISLTVPIAIFSFLNYIFNSHSLLYPEAVSPISFLSSLSFILVAISYLSFLSIDKNSIELKSPSRFHYAWQPYAVAVLAIALAAALRLWPFHVLGLRTVWVTFYPTVMLVAIYGGIASGLFATFLSCLTALFLWPIFVDQPFIKDFGDWLSMAVFIFTCSMISIVAELMTSAREKVKRTNKQLIAVNLELKNEIGTRRAAEKEISELNSVLEQRVLERTGELAKANEVLSKSEERFRSTLDNMLEGCQIIGSDWRYIYLNDTADAHNRRPKGELLGKRYMDMWPGIETTNVFAVIKNCLEERNSHQMENEFIYPNGTKGWFQLSIQAVPEGVFILSIDITDRKNSEEAISKLNLELEHRVIERTAELEVVNKELEAFSYSVSHDLRAPLRHISGFVELLNKNKSPALDNDSNRFLNIIADSAKQMGLLIDDLLNFSRMGKALLKYRMVDFNELVNQVIIELKNSTASENITWELMHLPSLPADNALMRIVFMNLLNNAVKYSAKVQSPKIQIGFSKAEETKIIFYVKDNGAGFDMKYAHKLFGVFQRLHGPEEYEGTGIGLATVRRIIHKHNGETWAEGDVGKGASFYFSLPTINLDIADDSNAD